MLREFGTDLPENVAVHVHDSTADLRQAKIFSTIGWQAYNINVVLSVLSWLVCCVCHCSCVLYMQLIGIALTAGNNRREVCMLQNLHR